MDWHITTLLFLFWTMHHQLMDTKTTGICLLYEKFKFSIQSTDQIENIYRDKYILMMTSMRCCYVSVSQVSYDADDMK